MASTVKHASGSLKQEVSINNNRLIGTIVRISGIALICQNILIELALLQENLSFELIVPYSTSVHVYPRSFNSCLRSFAPSIDPSVVAQTISSDDGPVAR